MLSFLLSDNYIGYVKSIEASFCMDDCSQYYLEDELGQPIVNIIFPDLYNPLNYINRFVELDGQEIWCIECSAVEIQDIFLSNACEVPVSCFADPCEIAPECQLNTPVECFSNYCGGCYADFYDLNNNLVNCYNNVNPCDDLEGLFFGMCDMYLGIAVVNGQCQGVSGCGWLIDGVDYSNAFFDTLFECEQSCFNEPNLCEDIENQYNQFYNDISGQCDNDVDCISVWGDCSVGLGDCHYAVNELLYNDNYIEPLVSDWINNDCMEWVCDCFDLPDSICNSSGNCELAYCIDENPSGCFSTGCLDNYICIDYEESGDCVPSTCYCDEYFGEWFCTEDCNGGTCFELGDVNYDDSIDVVDVVSIVNSILGLSSFSLLSDINSDNITNVIDVIVLVNIILN